MSKFRNAGLTGLAALTVAGAFGGAAHAQSKPAIVVRAEECLRRNVDRVVAADSDMASAANFLVTYACASEVAGAARFERNTAYVQMFATIFKSMPAAAGAAGAAAGATSSAKPPAIDFKASVDPQTGELVTPPAAPGAAANPISTVMPLMDNLFGQVSPATVPVGLRKLAGDLVLAAQEKRGAKAR